MKTKKIFVSLLYLGFIVWFGASFSRTIIAYDMFVPFSPDMLLKAGYTSYTLFHSVYLYMSVSLYSYVGYFIFIISGIVLFFGTKPNFKKRGWLFIAVALVFLAFPYEVFKAYWDAKLGIAIYLNGLTEFYSTTVQDCFLDVYRNPYYSLWASLSFLANLTAFLFCVWKPLDLEKGNKLDETEII
jgi:hypothetical protein